MGTLKDKRLCGIIAAVLTATVFSSISLIVALNYLEGTPWFIFSSVLRLVFGLAVLYLLKKLYDREPKEVLRFRNGRETFAAASGFLLYFAYYLIVYAVGASGIKGMTAGLLISKVILQQLTTGFYEEILFRGLMCGGYRYTKGGFGRKLGYALLSSALFGAVHILTGFDLTRFLQTGAIGFAFAVIYLQTDNILLLMILHFVYDIFANMAGFIVWNKTEIFLAMNSWINAAFGVMFVISVIMLTRKEKALRGGKDEDTYTQAR